MITEKTQRLIAALISVAALAAVTAVAKSVVGLNATTVALLYLLVVLMTAALGGACLWHGDRRDVRAPGQFLLPAAVRDVLHRSAGRLGVVLCLHRHGGGGRDHADAVAGGDDGSVNAKTIQLRPKLETPPAPQQ